jgi:restriction system protein
MADYRAVSPFTNILPTDLFSGFVGRQEELARIDSLLSSRERGIVILGTAGIGKSALARVYADRHKANFPGGIFTVSASWAESASHLLERAFEKPPVEPSLLIINDAEVLREFGFQPIRNALQRYPNLKIILTSRQPLETDQDLTTLKLDGLSRKEFQELASLRLAVAEGRLDSNLVERLFQLASGNPALASIAIEVVKNGAVNSWQELFQYLRNFQSPGLVDPAGQPLLKESDQYKQIIIDVSSANEKILQILKKHPELVWKLPSRKFEEIVAEILDQQGYEVSLTPASGDGGFDIYAARKEELGQFLYLVECKRYVPPNKVGVEIVRSLYGVLQAKRATAGAIVTTSFFTAGAEAFQREVQHQLHLHDYIALQKWMADFPLQHNSDTG